MQTTFYKRESVFVGMFFFAMCLMLAQSVHSSWFSIAQAMSASSHIENAVPVPAELYAPNAYRVAMPALTSFLQKTPFVWWQRGFLAGT
ncbi:MAG: hypothetical protein M3R43_08205 [Acidobacteriota bacterium]|nr:hypothetical protein [Acidobacteriota bacterium]